VVGRIGHTFGVKGFVKIRSSTKPFDAFLNYKQWFIQLNEKKIPLTDCQRKGTFLIGKIQGCETPEEAKKHANFPILIYQHQLPELDPEQHYWAELIGLKVYNLEEKFLGEITSLFETGANDVMVIVHKETHQEILIPYVPDNVIKNIDLKKNTMLVEWQPEWL
jgi:16S rRNA processing protein RimM